ncbi:hypothetical protein Q1695_013365 [Nippostrongylus brasiliensis]|nr:hypothetical protein Q1695_013365 [Nippostrongylus brasiliensis]
MNSDGSVVVAAYPQTFYGAGHYAQAAPFDPSSRESAQIPKGSKWDPTRTAFGCMMDRIENDDDVTVSSS